MRLRGCLGGLDLTKVQKITPSPPPSLPPPLQSRLRGGNNSFLFSADVEYFEVAAVQCYLGLQAATHLSSLLGPCLDVSTILHQKIEISLTDYNESEELDEEEEASLNFCKWSSQPHLHNFQKVKWHSAMLRLSLLLINKLARDKLYLLNHHWYSPSSQLANYQLLKTNFQFGI